jgi:hypothetical protein
VGNNPGIQADYEYDGLGLRRKATVTETPLAPAPPITTVRSWTWGGENGEEEVAEDANLTTHVAGFRVGDGPTSFTHDGLGSVVGQTGSFLINDRVRTYEGFDFEKVLITTRMAMDHLALGEWDKARVEIKRTHEREALIAELRTPDMTKLLAAAGFDSLENNARDTEMVDSIRDSAVNLKGNWTDGKGAIWRRSSRSCSRSTRPSRRAPRRAARSAAPRHPPSLRDSVRSPSPHADGTTYWGTREGGGGGARRRGGARRGRSRDSAR